MSDSNMTEKIKFNIDLSELVNQLSNINNNNQHNQKNYIDTFIKKYNEDKNKSCLKLKNAFENSIQNLVTYNNPNVTPSSKTSLEKDLEFLSKMHIQSEIEFESPINVNFSDCDMEEQIFSLKKFIRINTNYDLKINLTRNFNNNKLQTKLINSNVDEKNYFCVLQDTINEIEQERIDDLNFCYKYD